jgi:hypothetical protein
MSLIIFYRPNPNVIVARFGLYADARRFLKGALADGSTASTYVLWDVDKWEQVSCPETLPFAFEGEGL